MIIRPIEKNDESEVYHMWSRYHIDELPYVWARQGIHAPETVGSRMQYVVVRWPSGAWIPRLDGFVQ